jgi:hypothetical protein
VLSRARDVLASPVSRPAFVLVPAGNLLGALTVGVLSALEHVSGPPVLLLLGALLLGEILVLTGFASMWSRARHDARRPAAEGEPPQGWLSGLSALAPAAVTAALCAACFALLLLLAIAGGVLGSASGEDLLHDTLLARVVHGLLGMALFLIPATIQSGVLGSVTGLLVRRSYLDRDRRGLLAARETARTRAQVASVQRTTTPGRGWRVPGRRLGPVLVGVGLLLMVTGRAAVGLLLILAVSAALLLRLWRGSRSPATSALRVELAHRAGLPPSDDDAALVAFRAAELRAAATTRGWQPDAPTGGILGQLAARASNCYRGTVDDLPFTCWDRIGLVVTSREVEGREVQTSRLTGAATTVELDFPMVVRLAVVRGGPLAAVTWSHLGPRIDLESGEFNQRFDVWCDDPLRARLVLNPAVMALLLGMPDPVELVLDRGRLRLTAEGVLLAADDIEAQARLAGRIRASARAAMPHLTD